MQQTARTPQLNRSLPEPFFRVVPLCWRAGVVLMVRIRPLCRRVKKMFGCTTYSDFKYFGVVAIKEAQTGAASFSRPQVGQLTASEPIKVALTHVLAAGGAIQFIPKFLTRTTGVDIKKLAS